jgi:hypothetical protein
MPSYDNTNRGALFVNDRREKSTHPQYTGSLDVEGTEYWLSAWLKKSQNGKDFLSLSITPKNSAPVSGPATLDFGNTAMATGTATGSPIDSPPDEDIPF